MEKVCPICNGANVKEQDEILSVFGCAECGHSFTVLFSNEQETYGKEYYLEAHKI